VSDAVCREALAALVEAVVGGTKAEEVLERVSAESIGGESVLR